jgi:hypothetical protein
MEAWAKEDPRGAAIAEQNTLSMLADAALPHAVALLFALTHVFIWNQLDRDSRLVSLLGQASLKALKKFTDTFEVMEFDSAADLASTLRGFCGAGLDRIRWEGPRSTMARSNRRPQRWEWDDGVPEHVVLVPDTQSVRDALFYLHAQGTYWYETVLPRLQAVEPTEPAVDEMRQACAVLQEASAEMRDHFFVGTVPPHPPSKAVGPKEVLC